MNVAGCCNRLQPMPRAVHARASGTWSRTYSLCGCIHGFVSRADGRGTVAGQTMIGTGPKQAMADAHPCDAELLRCCLQAFGASTPEVHHKRIQIARSFPKCTTVQKSNGTGFISSRLPRLYLMAVVGVFVLSEGGAPDDAAAGESPPSGAQFASMCPSPIAPVAMPGGVRGKTNP